MGLYDRQYYRDDERPGISLGGQWSAVTTIIAINVALFVANLFSRDNWLTMHLAIGPDLFSHPLDFWQLLTHGFVHDPDRITHIAFNMLALFFFGREVEELYGKAEFYKFYLSAIVFSGFVQAAMSTVLSENAISLGASGGVTGVAVLFACHFPKRTVYVWGVFGVPAMVLVVIFVAIDFLGTLNPNSQVGHWSHLGGALAGFIFFKTKFHLLSFLPSNLKLPKLKRGPKLRVHREEDDAEAAIMPDDHFVSTEAMQRRVDALLEKIHREGEASLSAEERDFLTDASRKYQQQRRR